MAPKPANKGKPAAAVDAKSQAATAASKRKATPDADAHFKPQGKVQKRTPKGVVDGAAGNDECFCEDILDCALKKGVKEWLVKWKDWPESANTWR